MVRLQKRFAYKYKEKDHYKHVVVIPDKIIESLGWKAGAELVYSVNGKELIFTQSKQRSPAGKANAEKG